jgi:hypothetical protein
VQTNFLVAKAMSHPREQYLTQLMRMEGTRHSPTQTDRRSSSSSSSSVCLFVLPFVVVVLLRVLP